MLPKGFKEKKIAVYANEAKDLIFLTESPNPKYNKEREEELDRQFEAARKPNEIPHRRGTEFPYTTAQVSFTLTFPYTVEEVAEKLAQAADAWGKYPPYKDTQRDPIQLHLGINNFRQATLGYRFIDIRWFEPLVKQAGYYIKQAGFYRVSFFMPCKSPRQWMGIDDAMVPEESEWIDIANAVIKFAQTDLKEFPRFKTYKRYLNLTLPKKKKSTVNETTDTK